MEVHLDPTELERWERIDDVIYDMSPSPSTEHQRIVGRLYREISAYLKGKTCEGFTSPFDVYLDGDEARNYVQPDITIVCDPSKLRPQGCIGAPDMVVEVLSPSTAYKDKTVKLRAYRLAGVHEYWIVDPHNQFVEVYRLAESNVFPTVYNNDAVVTVGIFQGLEIDLREIF
ncbi:Uma2 family endonuclease [Alicyclobacillus dauci]|uniref:Uma2 family endonuclease n=1 Tax=Alicyclobacillus dauci TaxID=1475485 RepID=A0ABY6Z4Y4_9BACL|nr:Uma2 family endonuclease [Alicyclobacillus dauci]WAH37717.1 Uma2 family endonuclease [Alicyclobacillus dauci]